MLVEAKTVSSVSLHLVPCLRQGLTAVHTKLAYSHSPGIFLLLSPLHPTVDILRLQTWAATSSLTPVLTLTEQLLYPQNPLPSPLLPLHCSWSRFSNFNTPNSRATRPPKEGTHLRWPPDSTWTPTTSLDPLCPPMPVILGWCPLMASRIWHQVWL